MSLAVLVEPRNADTNRCACKLDNDFAVRPMSFDMQIVS